MTRRFIAAILFCSLFLGILFQRTAAEPTATQVITFIDVGQGDSALLQDHTGIDVLIDGGILASGQAVLDYLRARGVDTLEVMLVTHPDSDHVGGLITVLQAADVTVQQILYNGYPGTTGTWTDFVSAAAADGLTLTAVQFPQELTWGVMQAYVLNPASGLVDPETNAASLVVRVDYGAVNLLFTGDIGTAEETNILARQTPVAAEILKVAHHGSASSSSAAFLAAAAPQDAVISVGAGNPYGHPAQAALDRLAASGAQVWRTDQIGNVFVTTDGVTYTLIGSTPPDRFVFLPLVLKYDPGPTEPPVAATGNIEILSVFADGTAGSNEPDEYVEIQNRDTHAIQVLNWTLSDLASHTFTFPAFTMQPNQVCRVYTNQDHPETCGFNYRSSTAIWNNTGDTAALRDSSGTLVDQFTYP